VRTCPQVSHMAGGTHIQALYQKGPVVERTVHCTDLRSCKVRGSPVDGELACGVSMSLRVSIRYKSYQIRSC
jgi:hypothetical protein